MVQSVVSVEMSVPGNIELQKTRENPDLVEYISTADIDMRRSQTELTKPL